MGLNGLKKNDFTFCLTVRHVAWPPKIFYNNNIYIILYKSSEGVKVVNLYLNSRMARMSILLEFFWMPSLKYTKLS